MWHLRAAFLALALGWAASVAQAAPKSSPHCGSSNLVTRPAGDITRRVGETLEVTCLLDPEYALSKNLSSSNLIFFKNSQPLVSGVDGVELLSVGDTTLHLRIRNALPGMYMLYCKIVENGTLGPACLNSVAVGTPPENITDVSCVSENWQNLTCRWKPKFKNYVDTNYTLQYTYYSRASRGQFYDCPNTMLLDDGEYTCTLTMHSNATYRQSQKYFKLIMTGSNVFDRVVHEIRFHHYAHIRPAPPSRLEVVDVTTDSARLIWHVHLGMKNFAEGFYHKIEYCSEIEGMKLPNGTIVCDWTRVEIGPTTNETLSYDLALRYANIHYDARVYTKVLNAKDDLWSNFSFREFVTKSMKPLRPPMMNIGGFEILSDDRKVFVHWQQLEKWEENGENFGYKIVDATEDGKPFYIMPNRTTRAYMVFEKMPLGRVELAIVSNNTEGRSENASRIVIPRWGTLLPEPKSITKTEFGNGSYELSWDRVVHPDLTDYTIFWCNDRRERPFQCESQLYWEKVSPNITKKNITLPGDDKIYQFAISANSRTSSSGMVWALCTIIPNKSVSKLSNIWINRAGSDFIEIGWKVECSDRIGSIQGFRIEYCPIVSLFNTDCKGDNKSINITRDPSEIHSNITNLMPYTTYSITVAIIAQDLVGMKSTPLINVTSAGPPTPPLNVTITYMSNDRITVTWEPPETLNGMLVNYVVYYDDYTSSVLRKKEVDANTTFANLMGLSSYSNYSISVSACTVACSNSTAPLFVRTAIGKPGVVTQLSVKNVNGSQHMELNWLPPVFRGGYVDFYEVLIQTVRTDGMTPQTFSTTNNMFTIENPVCQEKNVKAMYYYVRAVNIDNDTYHGSAVFGNNSEFVKLNKRPDGDRNSVQFRGPLSKDANNICVNKTESYYWIIYVVAIVLVIGLIFSFRKVWICYKNMQNIKPCLPPGLGSGIEKEGTEKKPLKWNLNGDKMGPTLADSVSLLDNGIITGDKHNINNMCDNSNYSENSDSTIVLSLTSSNHGTSDEAKDGQVPQDDIQSDSLSPNSSLRWRHVGSSGSGSRPVSVASNDLAMWNTPTTTLDDITNKALNITPYSTIGMPDCEKTSGFEPPQSKPYVSFGAFNTNDIFNMNKAPAVVMNPSFAMMQQQRPSEVVANLPNVNIRPTRPELPTGYVMNGISNVQSPIIPSPDVVSPLITETKPLTDNYDYDYNDSIFAQMSNENSDVSNKPVILDSGYVKRNDPIINSIDASCLQKILTSPPQTVAASKQANLTNIILPLENGIATETISPEAYCRFGPNTNVPQQFDFQRSDDDSNNDFSSSARSVDDFDYEKHSLFKEPLRSDPSVASSHYVPVNFQNKKL